MPSLRGHGFFIVRLACTVLDGNIRRNLMKKTLRPHKPIAAMTLTAVLLPARLMAHPGHYHPDETDEFDLFRSTLFHSHGAMDFLLAAVAVAGIGVACLHGKRNVRLGAFAIALGSLALLPAI